MDMINKEIVANTIFTVNGMPLKQVNEFLYLGCYCVLNKKDNDWPAINHNIKRVSITWGIIGKVLSTEREDMKAMTSVYRAVVQAVLPYGAESWVVKSTMEQKLEAFHHRCARYITRKHIQENPDG
jgi:gamma-glutamyl phosphate reductase